MIDDSDTKMKKTSIKSTDQFHGLVHQLSWILTVSHQYKITFFKLLAISSCLIRNDYNVLFGLLFIGIFNRQYARNKIYYSKIILQVLLCLIIFDIIWMCVIMPCWLNKRGMPSKYWEGLSGLHTFGITLAFFELGLKLAIGALVFLTYRWNQGQIGNLLNFNYDVNNE